MSNNRNLVGPFYARMGNVTIGDKASKVPYSFYFNRNNESLHYRIKNSNTPLTAARAKSGANLTLSNFLERNNMSYKANNKNVSTNIKNRLLNTARFHVEALSTGAVTSNQMKAALKRFEATLKKHKIDKTNRAFNNLYAQLEMGYGIKRNGRN